MQNLVSPLHIVAPLITHPPHAKGVSGTKCSFNLDFVRQADRGGPKQSKSFMTFFVFLIFEILGKVGGLVWPNPQF